jgi:hypothetical protein
MSSVPIRQKEKAASKGGFQMALYHQHAVWLRGGATTDTGIR